MFNNTSAENDFQAKQERDVNDLHKLSKPTSTSRQWGGFKNPRIVRVSKAFGGKDRHSKVCTVKGLRDRRIRLSVPTAIQLYDLQDRLGLSQPSKVIDWLLDATKDDIDKLPPLQMLPGDFNPLHFPSPFIPPDLNSPQLSFSSFLNTSDGTFVKDMGNRTSLYTKQGIKLGIDHDIHGDHQRMKGKEAIVENECNDQENGGLNFLHIPQYSHPGFIPYNPYYNWDPNSSSLSVSQFGNQGLVSSQTDTNSHTPSQFFLCPPTATSATSLFPPYVMPTLDENHDVIRQANDFQLFSSSSQHVLPNSLMPDDSDSQKKLYFGLNPNPYVHSQRNHNS